MSFGNLLGLLGLLGLVALLIIYLIRPNFQQKFVTSTYIWRKSLKYRKKRIPVNKIRNILLIICQILIIVAGALILTGPFVPQSEELTSEKIIIIDASGNMMAGVNDGDGYNTRFDRAVEDVSHLAEEVLTANGSVTVILADNTPEIFVHGVGIEDLDRVMESLNTLTEERDYYHNPIGCTYGEANMDAAIDLAQTIVDESPYSEVLLYTGTTYIDHGNVKVINVAEDYENEWNAAILNVEVTYDENIYSFGIDVASYGKNDDYVLRCTFFGVNEVSSDYYILTARVRLVDDEEKRFTFPVADGDGYEVVNETPNSDLNTVRIYSYDSVLIELVSAADRTNLNDSLSMDNTYRLYGGVKPVLNVQYSSAMSNSMTAAVLAALQSGVKSRWDVNIKEDTTGELGTSGYDMYVFENYVPETLPTDGAIIIFNPDSDDDLGITLGEERKGDFYLASRSASPLLNFVHPEDIYVSRYRRMTVQDGDFEPILYCGGDPVLLVKNKGNVKIAIFAFNVNFSLVSMEFYAFVPLMYNLFNYFIPSTFTDYIYEVNDVVQFNSRSSYLTVQQLGGEEMELTEFPYDMTLTLPGYYTVTETVLNSASPVTRYFFVKMPASESNILRQVDELKRIETVKQQQNDGKSLLVWFAAVMVALLFVEWWLQNRERS